MQHLRVFLRQYRKKVLSLTEEAGTIDGGTLFVGFYYQLYTLKSL